MGDAWLRTTRGTRGGRYSSINHIDLLQYFETRDRLTADDMLGNRIIRYLLSEYNIGDTASTAP